MNDKTNIAVKEQHNKFNNLFKTNMDLHRVHAAEVRSINYVGLQEDHVWALY